MTSPPLRIGVVGCGMIARPYLRNLQAAVETTVVACADAVPARARAMAREHGIPRAAAPAALLEDPEVDLVLDLTPPAAHHRIRREALAAGRHVYGEKPLAATPAQGRELVALARRTGRRLGCAPDTFLGPGLRVAARLLRQGAIGRPVAAWAAVACPGHEGWHPRPEAFYAAGGGPALDMGPYSLTALVVLLGPVRRILAASAALRCCRRLPDGRVLAPAVPTTASGVLEFTGGVRATVLYSFDVPLSRLPPLEVHGEEGSLALPDPNGYGGPLLRAGADGRWREVPVPAPEPPDQRGLGVVDLAWALASGRPHRASGELALHVLETAAALQAGAGRWRELPPWEGPAPILE